MAEAVHPDAAVAAEDAERVAPAHAFAVADSEVVPDSDIPVVVGDNRLADWNIPVVAADNPPAKEVHPAADWDRAVAAGIAADRVVVEDIHPLAEGKEPAADIGADTADRAVLDNPDRGVVVEDIDPRIPAQPVGSY